MNSVSERWTAFLDHVVAWGARGCHRWQVKRLEAARLWAEWFERGRGPRIMAMACWAFPIYSQTFVYQELACLIRQRGRLRFLYSALSPREHLPADFSCLWKARHRLFMHPEVCRKEREYYEARMPEKVALLAELLARQSGISLEAIRNHKHFDQAFAFTRMVEAYRPDYLHSYFFYEGTLFTFVASYLLNIPRGVSCYADHVLCDYELKVVPLHLKQCEVVVATSHRIKDELMRQAPGVDANRILVKPNAVDSARFEPTVSTDPPSGAPFRLVCACRIEPKKGLIYLVEAMAILRQRGRHVELHLLGAADDNPVSRDYAGELDGLIARLGLGGIVHREGRKTGDEVRAFFSRSHLFVAPFIETDTGDKDGIPTVLLEAMAAGLPVVATDAGSITEVIDDGTDGILVRQRDPKALADAIERMLNDESARSAFARRAVEKVRAHFDVAVCEPQFHQRILSLLEGRSGRSARGPHAPGSAPLVSVIVPFLNAEKFLWEAIESVLLQTYDRWELILIDDGSNDRSTVIAHDCAARFPTRIHYLEHDDHGNRGAAASRNAGIRHAKGKYLAFLDADDVWLPHKLEQQVRILEANPEAAMVYGATKFWSGWTGKAEDMERDHVPDLGVQTQTVFHPPTLLHLLYPLGKGCAPCPSDILILKEMVERIGGFEEHFHGIYQLYEDQAFLSKVYFNATVYVANECWDRYRQHPDSCVSVVKQAGQYDVVRQFFLTWLEAYLSARGLQDRAIRTSLEEALLPYRCAPLRSGNEPERASWVMPSDNHLGPTEPPAPEAGQRTEPVIPVGAVRFGTFRRVTPIGREWGLERGDPVDRFYIESFLSRHANDVKGRVLELKDNAYTRRFGGDRVAVSDVLHLDEGNPRATIIADLAAGDHVPSCAFDCIILTQTLQYIYDVRAALKTLHRILKPGGVLLATVPGISQTHDRDWGGHWYWGFTPVSARRLFSEVFPATDVEVQAYGNVLSAIALLHGLAVEELVAAELSHYEPGYEVTIAVRAHKAPV